MVEPIAKGTHRRVRQRPESDVAGVPRRMCLSAGTTREDETVSVANEPRKTGDRARYIDEHPTRKRRPNPAGDRLSHLATEVLTCALALACLVDDAQESRKARLYPSNRFA